MTVQSIEPVTLDHLLKPNPIFHKRAPRFGHEMLPYYSFKYLNLNNGSFGALPKVVTEHCKDLTEWQEENTDYYFRVGYRLPLVGVREELAKLVGASDVDELVMVTNTSTGMSVVLRNFIWESGDIIIRSNTTYGTVYKTVQYIHDTIPGVRISEFQMLFPTTRHTLVNEWRSFIAGVKKHAPHGKKIVAVIDSIVANPGVALPWKEMVKICKDAGIWTVVDGAHSVGQEPLQLAASGADFFVSSTHKWLGAKRGSAFLWMSNNGARDLMLSSIPTASSYISPGPDRPLNNFISQNQYNGCIDFTPYLSVHVALQWRQFIGGEEAIQNYCNNLARRGGELLAQKMGTHVLDPHGEFTLAMATVNVALPFPREMAEKYDAAVGAALSNKLLSKNMYAVTYHHNKHWWTRASVQIWNELEDFNVLGNAFVSICSEIIEEYNSANIPEDCKADSFEAYFRHPIKAAVFYDPGHGREVPKPVTSTHVVPVGYHTTLASIRP
ncbi:hypothetical protein GYMLUDRAFT_167026 [Collybiopsis luxurians FD-317 M1]|uniref:Unplaced genomic scaffold GYMLUscaffold_24, whole genome shotgun sequence n=1 Tax=Collybiopsis luxurians FD-317 M1 TaxID=944289 RepID=A0A0D0CQ10_9AGAR|nr:hypothetical protein GYMLUDRAFT_167026 [Collybiopsis luxurians FD-317 M1]